METNSTDHLCQRKVCDACRSSRKKCDRKRPSCSACTKRGRQCSWSIKRKSHQSWRFRDPSWRPPPIQNAGSLPANGDIRSGDTTYLINSILTKDPFSNYCDWPPNLMSWGPSQLSEPTSRLSLVQNTCSILANSDAESRTTSHFTNLVSTRTGGESFLVIDNNWFPNPRADSEYPTSSNPSSHNENVLQSQASPSTSLGGIDLFFSFSDMDLSSQTLGSPYQLLSDHHIPAINSLVLNPEDVNALKHYQSTFSVYRTTKDPKWSTHRLLLNLSGNNTMILRFILAVSINDISYRQENVSSPEARKHFKNGLQDLVEIIRDNSPKNYVYSMAGFLFLYLYLPKQRIIPPHTIDQLSMTVRDFVKNHELDSLCLERAAAFPTNTLDSPDRNVLARLIIWTFDEDVKCRFQGCGGYLAEYLAAHRERTMAVYEVSRVVLQAHWGTLYPQNQTVDDDDNAMELEFLWVLTTLWQDINELTQKPFLDYVESCLRIEQRFCLLKKKYSSVFQNSAMTNLPRTRVLMNADYDVVLFNALKVYYFRMTVSDIELEAPLEIQIALEVLLTIIQQTFASSGNELHDRLQWPLFLAGIETVDSFYWILSRISSDRVRKALETIIQRQSYSGKRLKRLTINHIRGLLLEGQTSEHFTTSGAGQHSFWDILAEL